MSQTKRPHLNQVLELPAQNNTSKVSLIRDEDSGIRVGFVPPERKNRWLNLDNLVTEEPAAEVKANGLKASGKKHSMEALLTFNSPNSPIRPLPIQMSGFENQLLTSKRVFPLDINSVKRLNPLAFRTHKLSQPGMQQRLQQQ